jgi:hypothetical protein
MKTIFAATCLALALGLTAAAHADTCPNTIYYGNGSYLRSGSSFYYPNGSYLISGTSGYYPNGSYFKSGQNYYFSNGSYLQSGSSIYYTNGSYFKSGDNFYYPNGSYLKSGSSFYYPNGSYARSGSTLYLQNGQQTQFPVALTAAFGDKTASFNVSANSATLTLNLDAINTSGVNGFFRVDMSGVGALLNISAGGQQNGQVQLILGSDGSINCNLTGGVTPRHFVLNGNAATVTVDVKDGYDAERVRAAVQKALDSL